MAVALAQEGASLALVSRDRGNLESVAAEAKNAAKAAGSDCDARVFVADVSREVDVARLGTEVAADPQLKIAELQRQSLQLETILAALPERPAVERAATALPIETLEAQVQWVDHRLSEFEATETVDPEAEQLWRDRIGIMNSLVQLRYVEAQRLAL